MNIETLNIINLDGTPVTYKSISNSGGGTEPPSESEDNPLMKLGVTYYDCDGTILHYFTEKEFLAMSDHPELPTRPGLICQEWNWDFSAAQEYVSKYGICEVGATYITDNGDTRLYISLLSDEYLTVNLTIDFTYTSDAKKYKIKWGDGTEESFIKNQHIYTHKYSKKGDYVISIRNKVYGGNISITLGYVETPVLYVLNNNAINVTKIELGTDSSIGKNAFSNITGLSYIILPKHVEKVYENFLCCKNLNIILPKGVELGSNAFYKSVSNINIVTPSNMKFDQYAFGRHKKLIIPQFDGNLPANLFSTLSSIDSLVLPDSIVNSVSSGNTIKAKNVYVGEQYPITAYVPTFSPYNLYKKGKLVDSIEISKNIQVASYSSIKNIIILPTVTTISSRAFQYCKSLTSVTIPDSVTTIGTYAFYYCEALESVALPENITKIDSYTFYYCKSLKSITIPDNVVKIGNYAFDNCNALESVTIGSGVTEIGNNAFSNCYKLNTVILGTNISYIGESAFSSCYNLYHIIIPNTVTSIGKNAFSLCPYTLFDFSNCTSIPSISSNSFSTNNSYPLYYKIIVPDNLYEDWKAATNWSKFSSYIITKSTYEATK